MTQRLFLKFSELQVRVDGVNATSRHRDAVDEAVRESTRLVRQFRECRSTQVLGAGLEIAIKPDLAQVRALGGGAAGAALARWVLGITFMLVVTVHFRCPSRVDWRRFDGVARASRRWRRCLP